ncbi:MAG: oligopeptide/dipeptide ABC transporter ATP-binding protein, partial [Polaromonas sp.]
AGRVIEHGTTEQVLSHPGHPYTQGLIDCLPELGSSQKFVDPTEREELTEIDGVVPSIWELGSGCPFRERCPHAMPRCAVEMPPMFAVQSATNEAPGAHPHGAACWLHVEAAVEEAS